MIAVWPHFFLTLPVATMALVGVWLFFLGACVGSFLNVVIYRLPKGMSLIWPASHCPRCNNPIRWYDNVPIASWILLRGRCRDCKEPISIRYPLVETTVGLMVLLCVTLAVLRTERPWAVLPWWSNVPTMQQPSQVAVFLSGKKAFLAANIGAMFPAGLLCWLLCTEFAAAWIEADRLVVPTSLFRTATLVGLAALALLLGIALGTGKLETTIAAAVNALLGVLMAPAPILVALARSNRQPFPTQPAKANSILTWSAVTTGLYLGWTSILVTAAAVAVALCWKHAFGLKQASIANFWSRSLFACTLLFIFLGLML